MMNIRFLYVFETIKDQDLFLNESWIYTQLRPQLRKALFSHIKYDSNYSVGDV
jgi:hypothetical protein